MFLHFEDQEITHTKTGVLLHYIRWTFPLLEAIACARYLSISVLLRMFDPKDLQLVKPLAGFRGLEESDQRCPKNCHPREYIL